MSNNPNEVHNFEQLMRKYLKNNEQMIKLDYESPLKDISPIEPLLFQNDNINFHNIQNFEPRDNNDDLNKNIPNNLNIRNNLEDNIINNLNENKFITPSKPNAKNISNINSFINSSIEREKIAKEEKKKKQLEYQRILDEQIKEKKLRQKMEREKRLPEELLFEEKLKLENEQYQQENKIKNNKNINNLFSPEEKNINPVNSNNFVLIKNNLNNNLNTEQDIVEENINNDMKRVKSQPYLEVMNPNNIFEINKNQKYKILPPYIPGEGGESQENYEPSSIQNIPQSQIPIEHLVSTSSQIPAKLSNQNHPQYRTQNNYYPNRNFQNQSQNFIQNLNNINYPQQSQPPQADLSPYLTQRQYYDYKQKLHKNPSDLTSNTNISINPSNFPSCYQIPFNNNLINSSPNPVNPVNFNNNSQNINELFNMNINNQNYFGKIMEIFFHEQEKIVESYKETIEKLKNERDEAIYKNKANEEKILALQKMQKDQEILEQNLGYFPFKNSYQQNLEKTLDSIIQKNEDDNINKTINNKKDEQSINNINNNSNVSGDSKLPSLITSTKFVKVNANDKQLLETWKKDDKSENNNDDNNMINKEDLKNKYKLNGMDNTNAFMEKINLINNKILEPPDEPQNYLNENNISIISKTQKNEDKSFSNELSNRDDKEDKTNINNNKKSLFNNKDLEEIDNNIRDSDLSTQKFISELQSKDFVLNNVNNLIIQNFDNNISYSIQIKERLEEKRKQFNQNKNTKFDIISEKESKLSHNFDDEEKKQKYQNYAFKQVNISNSKQNVIKNDINAHENENESQKFNLKIIPGLKNIDNNIMFRVQTKIIQ